MQESTPQKSLTYRPSVPLGKIFHGTQEEVWPKQGQVVEQVEMVGIVASPVVHTNPGHLDKQCGVEQLPILGLAFGQGLAKSTLQILCICDNTNTRLLECMQHFDPILYFAFCGRVNSEPET